MWWRTFSTHSRVGRPSSRRWRWTGALLLTGLALIIAACGTTTGGSNQQTPTTRPTATVTPAPVPCTGWRIVSSPTNTKYPNSGLSAVSALSATAAWAVGSTFTEGQTTNQVESLIERWDGSAWQIVASANTDHGTLSSIAAISPTDVWAVGTQSNPGHPLIMHWDGTTWSVVPSPSPTGVWSAWLSSVAAVASNDVWAFGGQWTTPPDQQAPDVLVEHWDGVSWQIVSNPALPPKRAPQGGGALSVTRIPGTNQLWAAGEWHEWIGLGRGEPLIERWDGTAWQIVPSPALPKDAGGGGWNSVVALSATNAWAVGSFGWLSTEHPLIAHWDGTSWQNVVADPNTYGSLDSVAAATANDVRAAGVFRTEHDASSGTGESVPLIEQWNGTAWQTTTFPELPSTALFQQGQGPSIATDGAGNYWVVGSYLTQPTPNQYQTQPLILHCP